MYWNKKGGIAKTLLFFLNYSSAYISTQHALRHLTNMKPMLPSEAQLLTKRREKKVALYNNAHSHKNSYYLSFPFQMTQTIFKKIHQFVKDPPYTELVGRKCKPMKF